MNFIKDIKAEIREFEEGLRRIKYNLIRAENQQSSLGETYFTEKDLACPISLNFSEGYDYKADKEKYEHVIGRMFCIYRMFNMFDGEELAAILFGDFERSNNAIGRINYYFRLIDQINKLVHRLNKIKFKEYAN